MDSFYILLRLMLNTVFTIILVSDFGHIIHMTYVLEQHDNLTTLTKVLARIGIYMAIFVKFSILWVGFIGSLRGSAQWTFAYAIVMNAVLLTLAFKLKGIFSASFYLMNGIATILSYMFANHLAPNYGA